MKLEFINLEGILNGLGFKHNKIKGGKFKPVKNRFMEFIRLSSNDAEKEKCLLLFDEEIDSIEVPEWLRNYYNRIGTIYFEKGVINQDIENDLPYETVKVVVDNAINIGVGINKTLRIEFRLRHYWDNDCRVQQIFEISTYVKQGLSWKKYDAIDKLIERKLSKESLVYENASVIL